MSMGTAIRTGQQTVFCNLDHLKGIPVKTHSVEEVASLYATMLYVIGSYATVVHGQVKDFCDDLATHPDLYRQQVKKEAKAALLCCEQLVKRIGSFAREDGQYGDWLDITDRMEETVTADLLKLRLTIDNAVHRCRHEPHMVATRLMLCVTLGGQLADVTETSEQALHEVTERLHLDGSMKLAVNGINAHLQTLFRTLVPMEVFRYCKKDTYIRLGFDIIFKKLTNLAAIDRAAAEQALRYGVTFDKEDQVENGNGRKPWNDFQDSVVVSLYGETSDERLAAELGRTVAAVRARARTIGIRRDFTREERYSAIENWKKKRNQRTKTGKS